jgi:peptidyl-prolyl cis-trans isomerase C
MLRRLVILGIAAFALAACHSKSSTAKKSGPVIAKGDGFTITADEFKARLDEQSPFMRARYNTLERKKEFLDNLVRFEVLSREADKQGYRDDPEVQQTLRKIMVQKLVQKRFNDPAAATAAVPDADVQKYYDDHTAEFHRPKRVRASIIVFQAAKDSPDRAKKLAAAKKALADLQAPPAPPPADKKPTPVKTPIAAAKPPAPEAPRPGDPMAFGKLVTELSEDATSKAANGDIGLKTADEIEKAYSKELADALLGLKQGETSGIIEAPQAIYIARVTLVQEEVNRTLDQVKPQITARLSREKKSKEFDEWLKKLKDSASVSIDEKALDAIEVAAQPGAQPGGAPPPPGMSAPPPPPGATMTPMLPKPGGEVKPAGTTAPATK